MELALMMTTAVSVALAAAMALVAWRLARAERLRSAARVTALTTGLRDIESAREQTAIGMRGEPAKVHRMARRSLDFDTFEGHSDRAPLPAGEMFRGTAARSRLATVLAVGSFAVATSLALVIVTSRGARPIAEPPAAPTLAPAQSGVVPLELVELSHDRGADRITIRGVVRNPDRGTHLDHLTAIVSVFDREGGLIGNGSATVEAPRRATDAGSTFAVTVNHAAKVNRYRVSFRSGARVVPHVDRRKLE
jgi:hypothetical protein